ncbi:MAG: hypothetical protein ACP5H8_01360, partial [Candidatus Micrarchaeia archaeon]
FANISAANINSTSNTILDPSFVSINDSDPGTIQFNRSANITLSVSSCTDPNQFTVYKKTGFPQSRSEVLTGSPYSTLNRECTASDLFTFGVDSFSGYAVQEGEWNITTWVNGVQTDVLNYSGEPYNLTVHVSYPNGTAVPYANVRIYEYNGYSPFTLPQFIDDNVSNYVYANTTTNANGNISLTIIATGGEGIDEAKIGNYTVIVTAYNGEIRMANKTLNITYKNLPYDDGTPAEVSSRININYFKDSVFRVYARIKEWILLGGGQKRNITVYTNGTVINNTLPFIAGKPYGLNITVLNHTTGLPVDGATVYVVERNGIPPFALPQVLDSNVSNYAVGYTNTSADGTAYITLVITGGEGVDESVLGPYNASLLVYVNNSNVANVGLNVTERTLSYQASGSAEDIFSESNINYFKDKVFIVYDRIKAWLLN